MRHGIRRSSGAIRAAWLTAAIVAGCLATATPAPGPPTQPPIATDSGTPLRLVIDTDMAPDDIVAIASLLRDPSVEVLAITVVGTGEAHCPGGMFVARSIVTMLGEAPLPVACGRRTPIADALEFPAAWRAGADAGNGLRLVSPAYAPDDRAAEALLVELAAGEVAAGRRLTILTLGTLTNLAGAVALDPEFAKNVRVVSMLGAVGVPGNVQPEAAGAGEPTAEWNAHADPTAARIVFEAGFDLTLVPLDATNSTPMSQALFLELATDHVAAPADLVFELWARNPYMTGGDFYLWDPLAAAVVRDPTLVTTRSATLTVVEGAQLDGGRLIEEPSGHPVVIATSADREAFESFLLSALRIGGSRATSFQPVATLSVTAGDATCDAHLAPPATGAGLLRVEVENPGTSDHAVFVFGLGAMTWNEIEMFAAAGPPTEGATPPPVIEIVWVQAPRGGSASGFGESPPGLVGVACLGGTEGAPVITLAGPFTIGP